MNLVPLKRKGIDSSHILQEDIIADAQLLPNVQAEVDALLRELPVQVSTYPRNELQSLRYGS